MTNREMLEVYLELYLTMLCAYLLFSGMLWELLAMLPELLAWLMTYLAICVWEAGKLIGKGLLWLTVNGGRYAWWSAKQIAVFTYILIDECRKGAPEEEEAADTAGDADGMVNPYAAALAVLGLSEPFTPLDLKQVYRAAMKVAHTDMGGGSKEAAQALNAARDLIMETKRWK